jgi:hypothetical protein
MSNTKKSTNRTEKVGTAVAKPTPSRKRRKRKKKPAQSGEKAPLPKLRDYKPIPRDFEKFPPPAINPDELLAVGIDRVAEIAGSLLKHSGMSPVKATRMAFELLDLAAGGKRSLERKDAPQQDLVLSNPSYELGVWHSAQLNEVTRYALKIEESKEPLLQVISEDDQTFGEPLQKISFKECLKNLMPELDYGVRKERFARWLGFCFGVSPECASPVVNSYETEGTVPTHIYLNAKRSADAWWFIEFKRVKADSGRLGGSKKKV